MAVGQLREGDFVVFTSGRRYLSNDAYQKALSDFPPDAEVQIAGKSAARIYELDAAKLEAMRAASHVISRN